MEKVILLNNGQRKVIKEALRCSYPTIAAALKGLSSTLLAQRIREKAIEIGGVEYEVTDSEPRMKPVNK